MLMVRTVWFENYNCSFKIQLNYYLSTYFHSSLSWWHATGKVHTHMLIYIIKILLKFSLFKNVVCMIKRNIKIQKFINCCSEVPAEVHKVTSRKHSCSGRYIVSVLKQNHRPRPIRMDLVP